MRHPEVAVEIVLGIAALLVTDDHDADAVEPRPSADDGRIVPVQPVAVQLDEVGEHGVDVVEWVRAAGMAGDLHALHRREIAIDLDAQRGQLPLEDPRIGAREAFELLDLLL